MRLHVPCSFITAEYGVMNTLNGEGDNGDHIHLYIVVNFAALCSTIDYQAHSLTKPAKHPRVMKPAETNKENYTFDKILLNFS